MKKLVTLVAFITLVAVLAPQLATELLARGGPNENANPKASVGKMDVCHWSEDDEMYHLINVSVNAWDAHMGHGDGEPGEMVPGMEGYEFGEECELMEVVVPPTVTPGYAEGLTEAAGVRYKGENSGGEIYLGIPDLGDGNRVETNYSWSSQTYMVTFSFDSSERMVMTTITDEGDNEVMLSYDFDDMMEPNCVTEDWNKMDILLADRLDPSELSFNNVMLNEFDLGDFDGEGWNNWTVSDFDFSEDFMVSGDLLVDGVWDGNEKSKLQLTVGCL